MKIHFLNVGNGDCTILELPPDDTLMVVDVMNARIDTSSRIDFVNPIQYLKTIRPTETTIYRYIQTHPDLDHMDGLGDLLKVYNITNFWDTNNNRPSPEEYFGNYRREDWYAYQSIRKSDSLKLFTRSLNKIKYTDGTRSDLEYVYDLYSLSPDENLVNEANDILDWNLLSHIILVRYGRFKLLLSGDADDRAWVNLNDWISRDAGAKNLISDVTIFKAAHHGRSSSYCGSDLLRILNPECIVISSEHVESDVSAKRNYKDFLTAKGKGEFLYETEKGNIISEYDGVSNCNIRQDRIT